MNDSQPTTDQDPEATEPSLDLPLGEVIGRANRLLDTAGGAMPKRFEFNWQGIGFTVTPAEAGAPETLVVIEACLGRLPYTAQDATARSSALKFAAPGAEKLPGRITIDKAGLVRLVMEIGPIRAEGMAALLKAVTCQVLRTGASLKKLQGLLVA